MIPSRKIAFALVALLVLELMTGVAGASYTFSVAQSGDVQLLTQDYPRTLNATFQWVQDNSASQNITVFLIPGDLVQTWNNETQWQTFEAAKTIYTSGTTITSSGNHDNNGGLNFTYWDKYEGTNHYTNQTIGPIIFQSLPFLVNGGMIPDDQLALMKSTFAANPTKFPWILMHFSQEANKSYDPNTAGIQILNNFSTTDHGVVSGHVYDVNILNVTFRRDAMNFDSTLDYQNATNTSVIKLYNISVGDDGRVSAITMQTINISPTYYAYPPILIYQNPHPTVSPFFWNDTWETDTSGKYQYNGQLSAATDTPLWRWSSITPGSITTSALYQGYIFNQFQFGGGTYSLNYTPNEAYSDGSFKGGIQFGRQELAQPKTYSQGNGYLAWFYDSSTEHAIYLSVTINGVATNINTTSVPVASLTTPRNLTVVWDPNNSTNNILVYVDGTLKIRSSNKTFSSGYSGPYIHSTSNTTFSNLSIRQFASFINSSPVDSTAGSLQVQFADTSTNSPVSWSWDFGDGNTTGNTVQNPSHYYTSTGIYTVNLTTINALGSVNTASWVSLVNITLGNPVASFTTNTTSGTAPLAVQFNDTSTNAPTSWYWVFGDGSTSVIQNATHTYTIPGNYTVNLTATNAAGSNTSASQWINVTPSGPSIPVIDYITQHIWGYEILPLSGVLAS